MNTINVKLSHSELALREVIIEETEARTEEYMRENVRHFIEDAWEQIHDDLDLIKVSPQNNSKIIQIANNLVEVIYDGFN